MVKCSCKHLQKLHFKKYIYICVFVKADDTDRWSAPGKGIFAAQVLLETMETCEGLSCELENKQSS